MSKFINGPAKGINLSLGRSPYFLRAVRDPRGKWDALDKIDDEPALEEEIHVYRIASEPIIMHVDGRDSKTGKRYGRWTSIAEPSSSQGKQLAILRRWTVSITTKNIHETTNGSLHRHKTNPSLANDAGRIQRISSMALQRR